MRGTIRSLDQVTIDKTGESASAARAHVEADVPKGYELISNVASGAGGNVSAHGVARSTQTREVEGPDLAALRAATPDGWQLIAMRTG